MADPVITLENKDCLVKGEKEIRTKGFGFIHCNKHDLIKINKKFLNFKIRQCKNYQTRDVSCC